MFGFFDGIFFVARGGCMGFLGKRQNCIICEGLLTGIPSGFIDTFLWSYISYHLEGGFPIGARDFIVTI